ncbi:LuxR family transcriptional regulator [Streptomyces sp. S.PB5]|uniref:helix-turn-helix transcriptional regulator n=1 Tax=Streptomyces sp. S.PB5 TaxID=3020844 RepID=UPI0025B1707E|nr:LuxR family transcriptional regulator [Streptomyces sp. S.PB5]MDN3026483.1 helix-turn-helix transcriptional regulator [Streptomyces sp. S.PB5]
MTEPHAHGTQELCEAGLSLYTQALSQGRVRAEKAAEAPCLLDLGLLYADPGEPRWLRPIAPAFALHRLLRGVEDRIAAERRREEGLAAMFEPLMDIDSRHSAMAETPVIGVLSGKQRINDAITKALAQATREMLCVQPHSQYVSSQSGTAQAIALDRDQALLDRGGRIRTLYQHTQRHTPLVLARYEQLRGDAEARTLDEVTDRLILIDRTVAFIPANPDRTLALEIRQPAIVGFLATAFDRLWRLATPMYPEAVQPPTLNGITPRQRAIAALLVEGHTDAVIAARLGLNIRTAREHIAKLAATLGSESRAQLGYLIGRSGILDRES